jgi:hypothetical protein
VVVPGAPPTHLSPFLSISAVLSHVPYILGLLTAAKHRLKRDDSLSRAPEFGKRSALKRLEAGANRKDLFYYLVCQHTEFGVLTSLNLTIERRGSP